MTAYDLLVSDEFGPALAQELREDLPEIDARMVPMPWHNDTCPKWIAEFPNGAVVVLWAEARDPEAREYVGGDRFIVQVYSDGDATLTGVTVVPETGTDDPAALPAMIAAALDIAAAL